MTNSVKRAAIDVGTNTVLLTVIEMGEDGASDIVLEKATVTRLGFQVDKTGQLDDAAVSRTLECFKEYRKLLDENHVSELRAVGTSALRDAKGSETFLLHAEQALRTKLEVIDGAREAKLTFHGGVNGLNVFGTVLVFDIGGGSTELILGDASSGQIYFSTSLNLGSVRLSERFQLSDPPKAEELCSLREFVKQELSQLPLVLPPGIKVIGVAGTVTTLCALARQIRADNSAALHGKHLLTSDVSHLVVTLSQLTTRQRLSLPGMAAGRADVIVAGAILCEELLLFSAAQELIVSDRGVRFGLLAEFEDFSEVRN